MKNVKIKSRYTLVKEITIDAPKADVWKVLADFTSVSDWVPSVTESYGIGNNERLQVGSGRHCEIKGFGGIDEYITQLVEGESFVYSITPLGPLSSSLNRWSLSSIKGNTTRLKIEFFYNVRFGIFGRVLHALVMRKKLEKSLPETLKAVKKHVESGGVGQQMHAMHTALA